MKPVALVVGGTSGLGLELARLLVHTHDVFVSGRREVKENGIRFIYLDLAEPDLACDIESVLFNNLWGDLLKIDLIIYAAGFFQEGRISDLSYLDIEKMNRVGLVAPALVLQTVLEQQGELSGFIAVTSTSQWTPRLREPMYTAVKAGLGMLANSLSLDPRVGKVLVVGPAGMNTRFWEGNSNPPTDMLDPAWVAEQTMNLYKDTAQYTFVRILRNPVRVELVEQR